MRIKAVTLGVVLVGTTLGSAALTLGRARGAAWIGQPLELVVPVQVDPGQADGPLCAEADVFHGDSRQEGSRVQVQVTPTDQPDTFNVKVTSSALIDEPVVTVYLRAGCTQKFSRKYVLLADFPSETSSQPTRTVAPVAAAVPLVVPPADATTGVQPANTSSAKAATPPKDPQAAPKPAQTVAKPQTKVAAPSEAKASQTESPAKTAKVVKPAEKSADAGKPRLRLDPVETLSERVRSLETTTTKAPPKDDAARDSQRMELLQNDMKALLDQAAKNEASLVAMRERLERAESERVPVTAVYALGALVALCMAALAYMWSKRPKVAQWNHPDTEDAAHRTPARAVAAKTTEEDESDEFSLNAEVIDKASFDAAASREPEKPAPVAEKKAAEIPAATKLSQCDFNADYLVDLRQQAEFLAKLGKVDDAMEVLAGGIRINPKESPLLFMDLLGITNTFNRKLEFREARAQFVDLFNVSVPEKALNDDEGRSLDAYPALLEHINSQWESPHVLDVIEACILRDPESREADPFDLAAFRELVNMHGVAAEHHGRSRY